MHPRPGDWLVSNGSRVGAPGQRGRILEIRLDRVRQLIHEEDGHARIR
ncbi:hypothetical protein RAM_27940 [Amycolatopsis mediterranei S699]|uniref:DUF1918 domain-containing protein n=1 Tax=Amycolatopsis mediterranei (strain S699) TaxID=713604 RepID=A0A9R0P0N3_AMYMS|nr:DUF1918 domain-containing protein [Amycolatopsis mediterranei]AEK44065.1 hypothetical protein RAM_27940 [Amycolatopsis mediterranei S699]